MRIQKNLLKPAVLLTAVCLFLAAGGAAEAAKLLGIHASDEDDTGDTSTILLIDTSLGTSTFLADTGLSRVKETTDSTAENGLSGPNGLAYDTITGTAYFASAPNSGGGAVVVYSVAVDPPAGPPVALGTPDGTKLFDAAFFAGRYWYIDASTDDLHSITFDPFTDVKEADILSNGGFFAFGDIAIKDGTLYANARKDGDKIVFFSLELSDPAGTYSEHQSDLSTLPVLQLAFGGEGTLFGQTGALTVPAEDDLYYLNYALRGAPEEG